MDYAKINEAAMGYKDDMTKFLRDLVRIPGESCGEKGHIMRIKEEMENDLNVMNNVNELIKNIANNED